MVCGLPFSRISKSSALRSVTCFPSLSVTTTSVCTSEVVMRTTSSSSVGFGVCCVCCGCCCWGRSGVGVCAASAGQSELSDRRRARVLFIKASVRSRVLRACAPREPGASGGYGRSIERKQGAPEGRAPLLLLGPQILDGRAQPRGVGCRGRELEICLQLVGRALVLFHLPVEAAEIVVRPRNLAAAPLGCRPQLTLGILELATAEQNHAEIEVC